MGMVRQWQQLLHGNRLSHSYTEAMPDFVKLAEAYGGHGIRIEKPGELDDAIKEMISVRKPVLFDCRVATLANCFPMIPSGKPRIPKCCYRARLQYRKPDRLGDHRGQSNRASPS
jgi:acetolactate synthase-1/2/3 large subunit